MEEIDVNKDLKINICLSSAANTDIYTKNHKTSFINKLPKPILNKEHKKLYIKAKAIALSSTLTVDNEKTSSLVIWVREVQEQRANNKYANTLTSFSWPPLTSLSTNYGYQIIKHAPFLPIRFQQLSTIQIEILDIHGEIVELKEGPPTLVWIQISNEDMEDQFTITSTSHHPELFPRNELNLFNSPVPTEMSLSNYEVGLSSIIYPSNMDEDAIASITIDNIQFYFDLLSYNSSGSFFRDVRNEIEKTKYKNIIRFNFQKTTPGIEQVSSVYKIAIIRSIKEGKQLPPISITVNESFTKACGQINQPRGITYLKVGQAIVFKGRGNIFHSRPNPLVMLHCDIIKPNIMSGSEHKLMSWIPLKLDTKNITTKLHEPEEIIFHPVKEIPFNSIGFKLTDSGGRLRNLHTTNNVPIMITLIFRRRKNENKTIITR